MKLFLLFFVIILSSCAVQVHTIQKPSIDFQSYNSWCWMKSCDPIYEGSNAYFDEELINEIYNSIAFNMYEKGYEQGDEQSDLLVVFRLKVKQMEVQMINHRRLEIDEWSNRNNDWINDEFPELVKYLQGNLVIDIIDRKAGEVIWKSSTVGHAGFDEAPTKKEVWRNVKKAMKKLPEKSLQLK